MGGIAQSFAEAVAADALRRKAKMFVSPTLSKAIKSPVGKKITVICIVEDE